MTLRLLQIGEVAERVGLSLRTIRYYEEMGLIVPADRTDGGFRRYTEDHVDRLSLIKGMKPLGFSVQEIGDLLEARDVLASEEAGGAARDAALARLRDFAAVTAERVADLRKKLARGEQFAEELRRQTSRPRRAAPRPPA